MEQVKFIYLCRIDALRQSWFIDSLRKFSDLARRFTGWAFFISGSFRVLAIPNQIIRVKRNALKFNIQKPTSACNDLTVSTGDKEVRKQDRLYYAQG